MLEAGGDFTQVQGSAEDLCDDGSQLVSSDFGAGGWLTVCYLCFVCWRVTSHLLHSVDGESVRRGGWWWEVVCDVVGEGEGCEDVIVKPAGKHSGLWPVDCSPWCGGMVSCGWWYPAVLSTLMQGRYLKTWHRNWWKMLQHRWDHQVCSCGLKNTPVCAVKALMNLHWLLKGKIKYMKNRKTGNSVYVTLLKA